MMKKVTVLCLAVCLLCGCQSKQEVEKSEDYANMGLSAVSEKGIYHMVDTGSQREVYFYDFSAKKDVPLCSKVNCNHTNEDCDAYRLTYYKDPAMRLGLAPVYYQNKLYYFYENLHEGKTILCSSNEDGTDLKEVKELANMAVIDSAMFYDQKVWYTENVFDLDEKGIIQSNSNQFYFNVLDLSNLEIKTIESGEDIAYYQRGVYDGKIYLAQQKADGMITLMSYEDALHPVIEDAKGLVNAYLINNLMYGYDEDRGKIYQVDITTNEKKDVMDIEAPQGYIIENAQTDDHGIMTLILSDGQQTVGEMYVDLIHQNIIKGEGKVVYLNGDTYYRLNEDGQIVEE